MDKKKILIDLKFLSNLNNGFGQVCMNYGRTWSSICPEDMEVTLLVPEDYIGKFGNNLKYLKHSKKYKYFPFLLPSYDIWHSITQKVKYLPFNTKTKKIISIHDFNFLYEESEEKIRKRLKRMQLRIDLHDKITAISEYAKKDIINHINLKGKEVTVINNGVEFLDSDKAQIPAFVQTNIPFFFTIGQICEKKNFHVLLDLMKIYPEYNLYIVGENFREYALKIKERVKNEYITNVFLPGAISENEKIWLYQHCKAFLFPSKFEGFGAPVIEALEFGKPVFSSRYTCLEETGKDHVYYWDNFEAEHMKAVMDKNIPAFYADEQKIETVKNYAASFSYERHINAYIKIYQEMCLEKKKRKNIIFNIYAYFKMAFS